MQPKALSLESDRWVELQHAYGSAADTPELIRKLAESDQEALSALIGSINHQRSVYSSSFAAVPHLVEMASELRSDFGAEILYLVGSIHAWSTPSDIDALPGDIRDSYLSAIDSARLVMDSYLVREMDENPAIYLLESAAAIFGFKGAGRVLSGLASKEFTVTCPDCSKQLYVWPRNTGLEASASDPVSSPNTKWSPVAADPNRRLGFEDIYLLLERWSENEALLEVQKLLPYLFGQVTCPNCGVEFGLFAKLTEESELVTEAP